MINNKSDKDHLFKFKKKPTHKDILKEIYKAYQLKGRVSMNTSPKLGFDKRTLGRRLGIKLITKLANVPFADALSRHGGEFFNKHPILTLGLGVGVASGLSALGKSLGDAVGATIKSYLPSPASIPLKVKHNKVFMDAIRNDPVLEKADINQLKMYFETMKRFAPTLATDVHAVKSFLREAATYGEGPGYHSIANLAQSESTIARATGGR